MSNTTQIRASAPEANIWWLPGQERPHESEPAFLDSLINHLNSTKQLSLRNYWDLHQWSVHNQADFWDTMWKYFNIIGDRGHQVAYTPTSIEKPQSWFPGAKLNYAENLLLGHRNALSSETAIISCTESQQSNTMSLEMGRISWAELYEQVRIASRALSKLGVKDGDTVASYSSSNIEMIIAFLAASTLGAIYSSSPAEFGPTSVIDRFSQLRPKVIFSIDSTQYNGKLVDTSSALRKIVSNLDGITHIVMIGHSKKSRVPDSRALQGYPPSLKALSWQGFLSLGQDAPNTIKFWRGSFMHPLWVVFSSGTSGKPKAIIHPAGGMLLPRRVVNRFHINLDHRDVCCQFTTMGWVMYNISLSFLASGCTLVVYDGSPFRPIGVMWDMIQRYRISYYGTSPRYLQALEKAKYYPRDRVNVSSLKVLAVTGAPVTPENYNFVERYIKKLYLFNGTGGTEIASSFSSGVPTLPIYRGEIQAPTLGVAVESISEDLKCVRDEPGSLVVTRAFPNMPTGFLNDPDRKRFLDAYFKTFSIPVWDQQDHVRIASNTGGMIVLGRSDGILNPGGVRFGSAEIYNIVETFSKVIEESICVGQRIERQDERVVLFLKMRENVQFTEAIKADLKRAIAANLSVRHIPAVITTCTQVPVTTNGKKAETYVKKLLNGIPLEKLNTSALANPECLHEFINNPHVSLTKAKL